MPDREQENAPHHQTPLARHFHSLPARTNAENAAAPRVSNTAGEVAQHLTAGSSRMQTPPESHNDGPSTENPATTNEQEPTHDGQEHARREAGSMESVVGNIDQDWSTVPPVEEASDLPVGSEDLLG